MIPNNNETLIFLYLEFLKTRPYSPTLSLKQYDKIYQNYCIISNNDNIKHQNNILTSQSNIDKFVQNNPNFITILDHKFPAILKAQSSCNIIYFYQGNLELLIQKSIAIVGSRETDINSEDFLIKFLRDKHHNIISGLAKGIDGLAHQLALNQGLKCIAILPCSLEQNSFYPQHNFELKDKIVFTGLALSEYPFGTKPKPSFFATRNRLVVGLSDMVIVAKCSTGSGSLISGKMAIKQGKPTLVYIPNQNINGYEGSHELVKLGAKVIGQKTSKIQNPKSANINKYTITSIDDLCLFILKQNSKGLSKEQLTTQITIQYKLLKLAFFETNQPLDVNQILFNLELAYKIKFFQGLYYLN
jgi:DNA processing protein